MYLRMCDVGIHLISGNCGGNVFELELLVLEIFLWTNIILINEHLYFTQKTPLN